MVAALAYLILRDSLTGSDDFANLIDNIVEGIKGTPNQTQADFALCGPGK